MEDVAHIPDLHFGSHSGGDFMDQIRSSITQDMTA